MLIRENFKEQFKRFSMEGISKEVILNYFRLFKAIKKKYPNIFKELNHKLEDNFHMKANDYGNIDNYKKFKYLESVVDFLMGQVSLSDLIDESEDKILITSSVPPTSLEALESSAMLAAIDPELS